jgi:hypothetical protein
MAKANDGRHKVSDDALSDLGDVMYAQDDFGIGKYGVPLASRMGYDWLAMAQEELADMIKYLRCEKERKQAVVSVLKAGLLADDPAVFISQALVLLEIGGTGKANQAK